MKTRLACVIVALLGTAFSCIAEIERVQSLLESLLQPSTGSTATTAYAVLSVFGAEVPKATPEQLATLTPIVQRCLGSANQAAREGALRFISIVGSRYDSAELLKPYEDYLITQLDSPSEESKRSTFYLLANEQPKPTARVLNAFLSHLTDRTNTGEQFRLITETLLMGAPHDQTLFHRILTLAAARPPQDHAGNAVIEAIGHAKITSDEALGLLRRSLGDFSTSFAAVQAVRQMPTGIRQSFASELQAVAENPAEQAATREEARSALLDQSRR